MKYLSLSFIALLLLSSLAYAQDAYEPDNIFDQAKIVVMNSDLESQSRNFHSETDTDWLKFFALAGQTYTLKVFHVAETCDPGIELYDTDGLTRLETRDYASEGRDEVMDWECAVDGIYYIRLYSVRPPGDGAEYDVTVFRAHSCSTGIITGTITDARSGDPVSGARLKTDREDTAISDPDGMYRIAACTDSAMLTILADGYELRQEGIRLEDQGIVVKNIVMGTPQPDRPKLSVKPASHDFGAERVQHPNRRTVSRSVKRISPLDQLSAEYEPSQVIIKMKPTRSSDEVLITEDLQAEVIEEFMDIGAQLWQISGMTVKDALLKYWDHPDIAYIEPNFKLSLVQSLPDDPEFGKLWGLHNTGQTQGTPDADIDLPEAWDVFAGGQIVVAVIDSGVDYTHPDLGANMWINPGEIQANGIDDDGNGYIDDVHGVDFLTGSGNPLDDNGHGTHCAGTIAAVANNAAGVAGINPKAKIMALRFLGNGAKGKISDAVKALEYAVKMGAKISNNSYGGGGYSNLMDDAVRSAEAAGHLFIAAAGNDYGVNNDVEPHYPSGYAAENIIAVASTDPNDGLSAFSNYGPLSVDIGAPGTQIYSTIPGNAYAYKNGTSMATPHVTGVVSLVWAFDPELTAPEVKACVLGSADSIPSLAGKTVTGGRLNAYQSLMHTGKFILANIGAGLLHIPSVSLDGIHASDFKVESDACSGKELETDASCHVKVDFVPKSAGEKSAILVITSDDPDSLQIEIPLVGTGTDDFHLTLSGQGTGQVKVNETLCAEFPCRYTFGYGESVTLEALSEDFKHWSGDIQDSTNPVQVKITNDTNITAVFEDLLPSQWQAEIHAEGEVMDGVSYEEWLLLTDQDIVVNRYKIVIGVGASDEFKPAPPAPPEYSVNLQAWNIEGNTWSGPYARMIRKQGEDHYQWIIKMDPHGNLPPPNIARTATLSWNPDSFQADGAYRLRIGHDGNGDIVIPDMKTQIAFEVTGMQGDQYFTVEFNRIGFNDATDINGDEIIDLRDAITGLKILTNININESISGIDGDARIGLPQVIRVLQTVSGLR